MSPLHVGLLLWAAVIAVSDLRRRRIPNALLLLVLVPQVLALIIERVGLLGTDDQQSVIGAGIGLAFFLPGYALKISGAGDAKFAAVCGLLLGERKMLVAVALVAVVLIGVAGIATIRAGWTVARQQRFPAGTGIAAGFGIVLIDLFGLTDRLAAMG